VSNPFGDEEFERMVLASVQMFVFALALWLLVAVMAP